MATAAQCAEHLLLKPRRFHELLEQGVVDRQKRGAYDLDKVREQYLRNLVEVAEARGPDAPDLSQARARLASEQADAQAMKNVATREQLLPRDVVMASVSAALDHVRAKLSALPATRAPQAFGLKSIAEVRQTLEAGVCQALSELAATKVVAAGAARESDIVG